MPRQRLWTVLPNVTSLLILVLLAALYFSPFGDLDFAMLIRLGELVWTTGDLRPPESFSYTIHGAPVPDFEWLFEIVIYGVWSAFGYGGLKFFKVLLVCGTLAILGLSLRDQGVRWHGIALAVGVAVAVLASGWNLRPLFFTSMGLLLTAWWLHNHCTGRRPLSWWLVPILWLWANVHPGVIVGQGLLLGAVGWEWINRWLKLNPPLAESGLRRLTLIGGAALAATFVSPDPVERLSAPFRPELRHPIQQIFEEMRPLYRVAFEPPYLQLLVYVVAALVLLTIVFRFRQYRLWEIALLAGLGVLANLASRSVQDWLLVMLCLGVPHLVQMLRAAAQRDRRQPLAATLLRLDRSCKGLLLSPAFRFQWRWPVGGLAVLGVVSLIPPLSHNMPLQAREKDPVAAVDWIEANGLPATGPWRIFAPPDYGSYLVWRLDGKVRCYVDTRGFCYPPEYMADAHYLPQLAPGWEARLKRVLDKQTQFFLLETQGPRSKLWNELKRLGVKALHEDPQAVVVAAEQVRKALVSDNTKKVD